MSAPRPVGTLDRTTYLGGSDAAGILGVSPWNTPLKVYLAKTEGEGDQTAERERFFRRRKRQEPVVAEDLAREYGVKVTRLSTDEHPNRYQDAEHPFIAAEVDFEFEMNGAAREHWPALAPIPDGTICNGEIKTVHPFKAYEWGEEGSEEIPIWYAAQAMHGLGVTGRPACLVAAAFGIDELLGFPILRDEETIAGMRAQEIAFWTEHVLARVPPDPSNMGDIKQLFARAMGVPVELTPEIADEVRRVQRIRQTIQAFEEEKEAAEFRVASFIAKRWGLTDPQAAEDAAELRLDGVALATWKHQSRTTLDEKALRAAHPEIARTFARESHFRVLRIKK